MKIINYDNYIKIGDRYYPPNSYILSTVDDNLVVITTLDNNINVTLAWTQFTDVNNDPYASLNDVITALLANNAFPPVVPADTITGTLTAGILPKGSGEHTLADSQVRDDGITVFIGAADLDPTSVKALFELKSTTQGFFVPRMTTAQQAAIGAGATDTALLLFNLTLGRFTFYNHADTTFKKLLIPEDVGNIPVVLNASPVSHTGNTNETILYTEPIPANTYSTNTKLNQEVLLSAIGLGGVKTIKSYINTTNNLTGSPVLISTYFTNSLEYSLLSSFFVDSVNSMKSYKGGSTNAATYWGSSNSSLATFAINWAVEQFLIVTVQLASGTDLIQLDGIFIDRNKK